MKENSDFRWSNFNTKLLLQAFLSYSFISSMTFNLNILLLRLSNCIKGDFFLEFPHFCERSVFMRGCLDCGH